VPVARAHHTRKCIGKRIERAARGAPDARPVLEDDLTALLDEMNVASDGTLSVPSTYLKVVIARG
jgi:hypothetical protein